MSSTIDWPRKDGTERKEWPRIWSTARPWTAECLRERGRRLQKLHGDERGALSALAVIVVLALAMLLAMVINVGRHVDDKIKQQNAADAATYSSTLVVARGMNALAFSNHLLCDTFALTAFMREARDRNAESQVPEILAAWSKVGEVFAKAEFPKFAQLGPAIQQKVPLEQQAVTTYGEMSAAISQDVLPVLEYSLRERLIPEFQRSVVRSMPQIAQATANDLAGRHGLHISQSENRREERRRGKIIGVLWRSSVNPVGYPDENDPRTRTLPAVDPSPGEALGQAQPIPDPTPDGWEGADYQSIPGAAYYLQRAVEQREALSRRYLQDWVNDRLVFFSYKGKMSQYFNLYHVFSCGQLMRLLHQEYEYSNLPHVIRLTDGGGDPNQFRNAAANPEAAREYLEQNFMFVGVAYRRRLLETMPGLFRWPLSHDPQTFAQAEVFVPRPRMWYHEGRDASDPTPNIGGGGLGANVDIFLPPVHVEASPPGWSHEGWPSDWSLLTQNWTVRLVPATSDNVLAILQTQPPAGAIATGQPLQVVLPQLGGIDMRTIRQINNH